MERVAPGSSAADIVMPTFHRLLGSLSFSFLVACGPQSEPGGEGLSEPGDAPGRHEPFSIGCARLHGECSSICDSPFLECYANASVCAMQWEAEFFDDFDDPLVDSTRMSRCADQVRDAACTSIEPDTLECEFAIVDACTGDRDALGQPYSPFSPATVVAGEAFSIDLCGGISEFLAVELEAGDVVHLEEPEEGPNVFVSLHQMLETGSGDAVLHSLDEDQPVPEAGVYLVELQTVQRGVLDVRLAVEGGE